MGLTIHYSLQSDQVSLSDAHRKLTELRQRALHLPLQSVGEIQEFEGDDCDYEQCADSGLKWLLIQAGRYVVRGRLHYPVRPTHIIAFSTHPGPGCEQANFGLCRYPRQIEVDGRRLRTELHGWSWSSFCKTQYASNPNCGGLKNFLGCHLSVIALLDHAQKLGILSDVSDEGNFWQQRDVEALIREIGQWNAMIANFAGQMKDVLGDQLISEITKFPNFEQLEFEGNRS